MGRSVLKVGDYSPEEIKELFKKDTRYGIGMRLYAVYQVSLGQSSRKLGDLYNVSFKQITNWVHRFEQDGVEGLKDKPRGGRRKRLNEEQIQALQTLIKDSNPRDHGYPTATTWTGPLLIDWISKNYGIEYKRAQIYNIMKSLGVCR